MPRAVVKRSTTRPGVEALETRELLAGGAPTHMTPGAPGTRSTPIPVTCRIDPASDPAGEHVAVASPLVALSGRTARGATVSLGRLTPSGRVQPVARTTSNGQGAYRFLIHCGPGTTPFTVRAAVDSGRAATAGLTVTRANQVVVWNSVALQAVRDAKLQAPDAARDLAVVAVAVYDAVNAIDPTAAPYKVAVRAPAGESTAAAAAAAAYTAPAGMFPSRAAMLGAEFDATLSAVPAGPARSRGLALGVSVADRILALRSHDGSAATVDYVPGAGPDSWVPTPPTYKPAVDPQWGKVTPFALTGGTRFRPPPPPAVTSAEFAAEVKQVEALGGTDSVLRTADQTALARFWSDLAGTFTPPGHWNQIAEDAAVAEGTGLAGSARMFALLDMALADAGIEAWGVKYADNTARPVTVIRDGAAGVNPGVTADPTWTPLWATPAFPSYVSGHSTFSAAAAAVLTSLYGPNFPFTDGGEPTLGLAPRHFAGFDQAAQEAGVSRIYGGIHYMSDNVGGLKLGQEVGDYVLRHELLPIKGS